MSGLAKAGKTSLKFTDDAAGAAQFKSLVTKADIDPSVLAKVASANPNLLKKLTDAKGGLDTASRARLIKALDAADPNVLKGLKKADDVGDAAGAAGKASTTDQAFRAAKYAAAGFAGYSVIKYIEKKYEDEEEDYKNCMAACLPHNWDEHIYGNVEMGDIEYSTPESIREYQIEPIPNQPYCKEGMECENFCGVRCDEESKANIPLLDMPGKLAGSAADSLGRGAGQVAGGLAGGLFEGLGLGGGAGGLTSSLASMLSFVFFMIFMLRD
jgi:hypothetical protein